MNYPSLSETRREYIRVGSTAASMRLTVSAQEGQFMSLELVGQ